MKLQHLFEAAQTQEDIWDELEVLIKRDCQPYLKAVKAGASIIYRGIDKKLHWSSKPVPIKKDRSPSSTPPFIHDATDAAMEAAVGFKARSAAAFVTVDKGQANIYGVSYVVFPRGDFDVAWLSHFRDLYVMLRGSSVGADWDNEKFDRVYRKAMSEVLGTEIPSDIKMQTFTENIWFGAKGSEGHALATANGGRDRVMAAVLEKLIPQFANVEHNNIPVFGGYKPELMLSCKDYYVVPTAFIQSMHDSPEDMIDYL